MRTRGVRSEYESGGTWDSRICIGRRGEATGTRERRRGGLGRGLYRGRPRGWGRILRRAGLPGRMRPMRMRCCIRLWRAIKESCVRLAAAAACTVRRAPCTERCILRWGGHAFAADGHREREPRAPSPRCAMRSMMGLMALGACHVEAHPSTLGSTEQAGDRLAGGGGSASAACAAGVRGVEERTQRRPGGQWAQACD